MRSVLGKAALMGTATLAALLAVEIVLRFAGAAPAPPEATLRTFTQYDPWLGWKGRPLAKGIYRAEHFSIDVALNDGGWRDDPWPRLPGADRRVVLLLGDSFAWGYGVQRGEMFADRVEAALVRDVRNYGVSGFGTDQELLVLERFAADPSPAAVVLEFALANDLDTILSPKAYRLPKPRYTLDGEQVRLEGVPVPRTEDWDRISRTSALRAFLGQHLRVYSWGRPRWSALKARFDGATGRGGEDAAPRRRVRLLATAPSPKVDLAWRLAEALVRSIRDEASRRGAPVVILAVPDRVQVDDALWEEAIRTLDLDRGDYDRDLPNRRLAALAARLDLPLADPLPALRARARNGKECFLQEDIHWNGEGHAVAADALVETLRSVLPTSSSGAARRTAPRASASSHSRESGVK